MVSGHPCLICDGRFARQQASDTDLEQTTTMPRGKLGMKLIENPKKRRATYKNRRDGLVQKTSQLATLCGVEALLVCFDPKPAGSGQDGGGGGAAAATTWPANREDVLKLIEKYRETPADKIRHSFNAATYYQEELAKQQRKLLKIEQCGPDMLSLQDCRLADLSTADLGTLLVALDETLRKAQQRIVALGGHLDDDGGDVLPAATAMVTAPHAVPMPLPLAEYSSFDLAFAMPDAGSMVTQYDYPPHDMMPLPQPVPLQPPCLAYHQMPLPSYTFQMPPATTTLIAPHDLGMTGTMDFPTFFTNFANGSATAAGFYDDFMLGFDATGGGVYVDDYVAAGQADFAAGHAGTGYQLEHRMPAGVWAPVSRMNNNPGPMDAAAFQEGNDLAGLPGSSCSSNGAIFQGGFQKK
ncbi:hypothetical protein SETIT_9G270800v2 [Setaria italica]|uniref:MADS-box domain-containing protein n=1 Tax=Setaria italica TaxID=4555 RepID=K4AK50_SETIT|nr:hypothetical protein SETIT_9G270800v2 [Setaria italica]